MSQPVALITGACGGMGQAGARLFGATRTLFLTDISTERLDQFAATLRGEGYVVGGTLAGDLAMPGIAEAAVEGARAAGPIRDLFHTAGLSPALAGAEAILAANLIGTERLLQAVESAIEPGLAAVLVASMAAYLLPPIDALERLCARPLDPDFMRGALAALDAMGSAEAAAGIAYGQSKLAVVRIVEARAAAWARRNARIVSISPGMIDTPMGRAEVEGSAASAAILQASPLGWGRPSDIARTAHFLCSDEARFITGCDVRADGGAVAALQRGRDRHVGDAAAFAHPL